MNLELQKEFLKELRKVSSSYGEVDIFRDACRIFAITLHQATIFPGEEKDNYEKEYMSYVKKYGKDGMDHLANCFRIVMEALESRREDFLGHVLESLNATNKAFSQFFTPEHISRLMARIVLGDKKPEPGRIVTMNDPACGAGALLIEGAEAFINNGGKQGDVVIFAEDLDYNACNIAYVQFSLLGYAARVTRKDSLSNKVYEGPWFTMGYFAHSIPMRTFGGWKTRAATGVKDQNTECDDGEKKDDVVKTRDLPSEKADVNVRKVVQGELF